MPACSSQFRCFLIPRVLSASQEHQTNEVEKTCSSRSSADKSYSCDIDADKCEAIIIDKFHVCLMVIP